MGEGATGAALDVPGAEPRHGVLLQVAYDGTDFQGWASQRHGRTVADVLLGAIRALDPHASPPRGTSRTDAGVHAEGQLAAFDARLSIPARGWVLALNKHLPDDACVRAARSVPEGYNPRFSAKLKRYRYRLLFDRVRDPLWRTRAWRIGWPVDKERLAREALAILGTHDFAAFRSSHDQRTVTTRAITRVAVEPDGDPRVVGVVLEGEAFLYNMVRILVGTLVDVARGRLEEGTIARALAEGKAGVARRPELRRLAGMTAPAHGLTLESVDLALPDGAGEAWPR